MQLGISAIIWATGYALDHRSIGAPILDDLGYPRNVRGVSAVPGFHFFGFLRQRSQVSASPVGPALDGPYPGEAMAQALR